MNTANKLREGWREGEGGRADVDSYNMIFLSRWDLYGFLDGAVCSIFYLIITFLNLSKGDAFDKITGLGLSHNWACKGSIYLRIWREKRSPRLFFILFFIITYFSFFKNNFFSITSIFVHWKTKKRLKFN